MRKCLFENVLFKKLNRIFHSPFQTTLIQKKSLNFEASISYIFSLKSHERAFHFIASLFYNIEEHININDESIFSLSWKCGFLFSKQKFKAKIKNTSLRNKMLIWDLTISIKTSQVLSFSYWDLFLKEIHSIFHWIFWWRKKMKFILIFKVMKD